MHSDIDANATLALMTSAANSMQSNRSHLRTPVPDRSRASLDAQKFGLPILSMVVHICPLPRPRRLKGIHVGVCHDVSLKDLSTPYCLVAENIWGSENMV